MDFTWTVSVHGNFQAHTLAAFRLFTCQRAKQTFVRKLRWQLSLRSSCRSHSVVIPDWGGGIISFVSAVSTGVANFIFQSFAATQSTFNSLRKASIGQNRETTSHSLTAPEHYVGRAAKVQLRSVNQSCRFRDYGRSSLLLVLQLLAPQPTSTVGLMNQRGGIMPTSLRFVKSSQTQLQSLDLSITFSPAEGSRLNA